VQNTRDGLKTRPSPVDSLKMGRRRREKSVIELLFSLVMLLALGWTCSPAFRQVAAGLGIVALLTVLLIALVAVVGWFFSRITKNCVHGEPRSPASLHPLLSHAADHSGPTTTAALISQLRSIDWFQFEKVVGLAFQKLGYHVTRSGGANPDGGIDLIIEKDGQETAVQCKQWKTWNVGVRSVREFLGALTDAGLTHGVFVTLNGYTGEARQLADKHGIDILDEADLASLLESTDARYDPQILGILSDTTKHCPKCERVMVVRKAVRGPSPGSTFWGCSGYPHCRYTMPV
jgi:HJR/Mrr/RecB family endonuclease